MDMNKTFFLRKEDVKPKWRIIDADQKVLGRLASEISRILRGKDKPYFTPHTDCGDYVIILNAEKVYLSGDKWDIKEYVRYTGWHGGQKVTTVQQQFEKDPTKIIELAVRRMLPKSKLADKQLAKLKIYVGNVHPHIAQGPEEFTLDIRLPSR